MPKQGIAGRLTSLIANRRLGGPFPLAIGLLVGLGVVVAAGNSLGPHPPAFIEVPASVVFDAADDPTLVDAALDVLLVQSGTTEPFRGTGAPGILLTVQASGGVLGWRLEGWANETTPPPVPTCSTDDVRFDRYDWAWEADGAGGRGTFTTKPSSVPERQLPGGDQCLARIGATGTWTATVCVEGRDAHGDSSVRHWYPGDDARMHYDAPDKCRTEVFQVGA